MRTTSIVFLAVMTATCGGARPTAPTAPTPPSSGQPWADEFDGPANSPPNPSNWTYDLGNNGGWGNRELESYTNLTQNVHLDGYCPALRIAGVHARPLDLAHACRVSGRLHLTRKLNPRRARDISLALLESSRPQLLAAA